MAVETISSRRAAAASRHPGLVSAGLTARRAMRGALVWGAVFGLSAWVEVSQFANQYPTAADRTRLVETMGSSVGLQAIFGPSPMIDTPGGYMAAHAVGVFGVIIGAVWGLLAATRLLRGEEDAGRWEVLLTGPVTRLRATAGAVAGLGIALLMLWAVTAAAYVAIGTSPDARFAVSAGLFAATATVAPAAVFLAVGALCSQLAATRRQAAAMAAAVFGIAYLIRVVAYSSSTLHWLRWASPLGWVDELRALTGSRPLLLIPLAVTTAAAAALTIILAGRRDLGASVLAAHDTAAARTRLLNSPLGLACRLGRPAVLGWSAALAAGGFIVGLATKGTGQIWANQTGGVFARLTGTTGGAIYLGMIFLLFAALIAMAAGGQVAATREEEAEGRLDHLLARPVTRLSWLAARPAVSAAALATAGIIAGLFTWAGATATGANLSLATLLAAGLNLVPAGIFVLGIGTLVHGLAPRFAVAAAYGLVAWSFLLEIVGASLGLSHWLLDTSILHHVARAPAAPVQWDMAAILTAIGIAAAITGALAFTRRDLKGA
ncbi:MAG TPA: ABC transporter permease subunit [Streptosporangiaceae bacterium]